MASILLKNLTISENQCDVLISAGLIRKIEPAGSCLGWDLAGDVEVMDCSRKVAVPGFVNMHLHAGMTLMKGIGEDMVFQKWLDSIWEIEKDIYPEYVYWATRVACIEAIRSGSTCLNDHYWYQQYGHKAIEDAGLRSAVSYVTCDRMDQSDDEREKDQCMRRYEEALKWADTGKFFIGPHAVYSVSEPLLVWSGEFVRKHGLKMQIHLSETRGEIEDCKKAHGGLTPVEYLHELGLLDSNLIAAHTLWLSEHDVELLGEAGVNCVHNINSNMKLSSGYRFLYNELRDAGANVCFGTDGCASSNNLDILEAMKTSAIMQKAWRDDPKAMPIEEIMSCATINGARAMGINAGKLEAGMLADISIVDTDNTYFLSPGGFYANLIYSAHSDCIDSVICNGKFVMKNRKIEGEQEVLEEARKLINLKSYGR